MLDNLYKKIFIIFISSITLVITVIIGVLCFNSIDSKQRNDSTFFQRLSMLMIYELENPGKKPHPLKSLEPGQHSSNYFQQQSLPYSY